MKKRTLFVCLAALLLLVCGSALGEEARDLTGLAAFKASNKGKLFRVNDGKLNTPYEGVKGKDNWITVTLPAGEEAASLYLVWDSKVSPVAIERYDAASDAWTPVGTCGARGLSHEVIRLEEPLNTFRLHAPEDTHALPLCEMTIYGAGDLPSTAQDWQPTCEKTDLMLVVAHPDDEYIFFGGLLPTYAQAQNKHVTVVYMTFSCEKRLHELLNGLWAAGLREYPIVLSYRDRYAVNLQKAYDLWGEEDVLDTLARILERQQPEVVVTHDVNGEYGHGAHRLCADACLRLIRDGARSLTWTPKKLYIHLWAENQIMLDWETPLPELQGQTALAAAQTAFKCHKSQQGFDAPLKNGKYYKFEVASHDIFDNALFGLAYTSVGPDEAKNDFMEHIE